MSKTIVKVWEKQSGESDKRWNAFVIYRDLPPSERTIQTVAETIQKTPSLVRRWSSENNWVGRVAEFDSFVDRAIAQEKRLKEEKAKIEMVERHMNVATFAQNKVIERILNMKPVEWDKVSIGRSVDIFLKMASFERLSRGLPSDSVESVTPERIKQQQITEARLFLKEVIYDFPILSERKLLQIVCTEFEVTPKDLDYTDEMLADEKLDFRK